MKRYILGILLPLSAIVAQAQQVKVSANIAGLKDKQVTLSYTVNGTNKMDTVKVVDGKFEWQAAMKEPQKVGIMFSSRYFQFFAEPSLIKITGSADSLHKLVVNGSKVQKEAEAFEASLKDISERETVLFRKYGKGTKEEQLALEKQLNSLRMERRAMQEAYISKNPQSPVSIHLIADRGIMGAYSDVKKIFDLLHPSARESEQGKEIASRLEVLKRSAIGTDVINFTQNNVDGKPQSFADFKGKYVLIDFWASWCGPCRAENPNVLKAYERYKDKNFTVIGISLDDNAERWKKAIEEDGMPWTQLSDLKGFKNEVSDYYGIRGIPSTLLIDPQGKIVAKNLRGELLQEKLAELLN